MQRLFPAFIGGSQRTEMGPTAGGRLQMVSSISVIGWPSS